MADDDENLPALTLRDKLEASQGSLYQQTSLFNDDDTEEELNMKDNSGFAGHSVLETMKSMLNIAV